MDFIFMLTRDDQTVTDCLEVVDELAAAGLRHIGFKDVGVDAATLARLHAAIKAQGATSYLEVVSTTPDDALASARMAMDLGVDCLLGGIWVEQTLELIRQAGVSISYFPFPGRPAGHPTRLGGTPEQVADDCRRFEELGCAGADLLAYRATEASPIELVRAARAALNGRLIVAGSVHSQVQIDELSAAGADAFTIGSAVFAGEMDPRAALLRGQLAAVRRMQARCPSA